MMNQKKPENRNEKAQQYPYDGGPGMPASCAAYSGKSVAQKESADSSDPRYPYDGGSIMPRR